MIVEEFTGLGSWHREMNKGNEDVISHRQNSQFAVISLADGVSSCKGAKQGAEIASEAITNLLLKKSEFFFEYCSSQVANFVTSHILCELKQHAIENCTEVNDYSSTIASVLIDRKNKKMIGINLGDGLIVAVKHKQCITICSPSNSINGAYVTTTRNAAGLASVQFLDITFCDSIMICSDGAWKLMYRKNRLKPEIESMIIGNQYEKLKEYLQKQDSFDDYSFVSVNFTDKEGMKTAC